MSLPSSLFLIRFSLADKHIWQRAWPMIIANISTPLLGFVDTAVIGHLPDASFLAGTALATLLISVLIWLLGFLRMSTTALVAEAYGANNQLLVAKVVNQGICLALGLSTAVLLCREFLFQILLLATMNEPTASGTISAAQTYFDIRIWATPVSLTNFVLTGYLLGLGKTRLVLVSVVLANSVNLVADGLFVPVFGWQVAGVAWASVLAEICQLLCLIVLLRTQLSSIFLPLAQIKQGFFRLISLNSNIFLRSACLQLVLSFMTFYAVRFGDLVVAANAILMQFFLFISFCLDGVAFALESLIGHAKGQNNFNKQVLYIRRGCRVGLYLAVCYSALYVLFSSPIINLLTNIPELRNVLNEYYLFLWVLPLVSYLSFVLDGVFIGLVWIKQMRNSMFLAALMFFSVFWVTQELENQGLWFAFLVFMVSRGLGQLAMLRTLRVG